MALLTVSHLSKSYPGLPVLHDVSFDVADGEIVCLLGPSGCGKTTMLRIVAGLEAPDAGRIEFEGQDLARVPVHRRGFGLMFQDFALFPHKDVFANVAFGLRMQGHRDATEIRRRVAEMLALVRLAGYERRSVTELSGGEQQRVALARSLAPGPRLLMLDEPLGSLDRTLREEVMNEVRAILKQVGVTALYVTHDQSEAFAVADRIFVMRPDPALGGRVEQAGAPREVYNHPTTPFVARFLGFHNLLPGTISGADGSCSSVETSLGLLCAAGPANPGSEPRAASSASGTYGGVSRQAALQPGAAVTVLIRPEAAQVVAGVAAANTVQAVLVEASFRGGFSLVRVAHASGVELVFEIPAGGLVLPAPGQPITLALDPGGIALLFDEINVLTKS